jgi:RNA polymerase sigma-70 factor, ECF subfamily
VTNTVAHEALAADSVVRSAAAGDEVAFARLVAEHHASMARVAFVICGDREATRDAVQTAWAIAWRRIGSLRDPSRIRPWLVAIAANEARKLAGRARHGQVVDISDAVGRADAPDPATFLDNVDLELVLRRLQPDERRLLALRYEAGLDSSEIALQLGITASGVRSRLARIIERLRLDLRSQEGAAR